MNKEVLSRWHEFSYEELPAEISKMSHNDANSEEFLFLILRHRRGVVDRLAISNRSSEIAQWASLTNQALISLITHSDFREIDRLYHRQERRWNRIVRPPSIVKQELMMFLGDLSIRNRELYDKVRDRHFSDIFLQWFGDEDFVVGTRETS